TRPMLDVLFSLDCGGRRVVGLVINQHLDAIALREAGYEAFSMFKGATHQIVRNANVQGAAATIGENVDPEMHSASDAGALASREAKASDIHIVVRLGIQGPGPAGH